jgi:hypothetical protein
MLLFVMLNIQVSFHFQIYPEYLPSSTAMTNEQRAMIMELRDPPDRDDGDWEMLDGILCGDKALGVHHEGGKLDALTELHDEVHKMYILPYHKVSVIDNLYLYLSQKRCKDNHTHQDCTES